MPIRSAVAPSRVLVIGAGPTTVFAHLPVLALLRDRGLITLAVICDLDQGRAVAARQQFGFLEDSGDVSSALARTDINVVYIFGSAQLHYECGLAALRNGKHLFVEKPIAPSYAQARELAHEADSRGLIAAGGLNRRFFRSLNLAKESMGKSRWRYAEVVFHKAEYGKPVAFGARTWLGSNGIHALDAMLYMMGELPAELTSLSGTSNAQQPDVFSALMRWSDGAQGIFLCNNAAGTRREEYVFHGLGESYTIADAGVTISKDNSSRSVELPLIGDGFQAEHEAFLESIRTGLPPRHRLSSIAPSLFIAELIENGFSGPVRLPVSAPAHSASAAADRQRRSILVVPSPELLSALTRHLGEYRFVTLEDVRVSQSPRMDVEAAILGRGSAPLPRDVLDKLPALRVVGIMALSLARHEPEVLLTRRVTLLNATQAYARSVGEFAFGLAIMGRRRAFTSHDVMREGGWGIQFRPAGVRAVIRRFALSMRPALKAVGLEAISLRAWRSARPLLDPVMERTSGPRDLAGATVGLIGWGANARDFAERLLRAQAHVRVYSEHADPAQIAAAGASAATLSEVLAADIVSLHRGLTPQTRHSLGAAELDKLRPGAVLINIARGALIEPTALLARLRRGDIFACLDTYDHEPLSQSDPLRRARNVFLTSHIAGGSPDMHAAAAEEVVRKVCDYLKGSPSEGITAERLQTMT